MRPLLDRAELPKSAFNRKAPTFIGMDDDDDTAGAQPSEVSSTRSIRAHRMRSSAPAPTPTPTGEGSKRARLHAFSIKAGSKVRLRSPARRSTDSANTRWAHVDLNQMGELKSIGGGGWGKATLRTVEGKPRS